MQRAPKAASLPVLDMAETDNTVGPRGGARPDPR